MKYLPFFISLFLTISLVFLLNNPISIGGKGVPALGNFFSPFSGFWQNTKADAYRKNESFDFSELKGKVKVIYDERMVPHIFADNHNDALFVQGFVTAQDRLWQMDISTRNASGRLAEVLGERLLERDKKTRRSGMGVGAEKMVESWKKRPESMAKLEAYVAGANAYISSLKPKDYPIEFKLMNYSPEPWSILKMAEFGMTMAQSLCSREDDLELSNMLQAFGPANFNYLFPEKNVKQSPIVPTDSLDWNFDIENTQPATEMNAPIGFSKPNKNYERREKSLDFLGSNNWAVAGTKTKSGNPILANDPHLQMRLPAIWYEIQLKTPLHNTYGVSFPGLPGIVIGFNENAAWGTTNGAQDVQDWYQIKWADDSKKTYLLDGKPTPVTERIEEIKIAGGAVVFDTVKYTVFGPITSESENSPYKDMALKWVAHEAGNDFVWGTFWNFNSSKNHDDFIEATNNYGSPNQNFIYADRTGDIGLKLSGSIPIRSGNSKLIRDGSRSENNWQGFLTEAQMPQVKNPKRGFVSSANQNPVDAAYPFPTQGIYEHYRGRVLNRKLEQMSDITPKDMQLLQNDNYSILAEELTPLLLKNLDGKALNPIQIGLSEILKKWQYVFDKDEIAPMLFEEWRIQFKKLVWDEIEVLNAVMPTVYPNDWRLIEIMATDPLNEFFDKKSTPKRETIGEITTEAFIAMTDKLKGNLEDKNYTWSDYKSTDIMHMGFLPGFSRKNIDVGGYRKALNAIQNTAGPSWRMVVELGDEVKGWGIFPGGQSGHPASEFYDDMISDWADGKYAELFFMKDQKDTRKPTVFEYEFFPK